MKLSSDPLLAAQDLHLLEKSLAHLSAGFRRLPSITNSEPDSPALERVLIETAERLRDNYPYFHPLYAGQMLKPPHEVARVAYALALSINPNNHAVDGGRASSIMEKEAVAELASMFGWTTHLGHLCSGGTMANLEALWIAGQLAPGKKVVASEQAHYTHQRISNVLKLKFEAISCDRAGRMNIEALEKLAQEGGVGTVVATFGTTATGSVDALPEILELRSRYGFRVHADAAYGGYFALAQNLAGETRKAFDRLGEVDSLVIDPHKHGLQPYGCGCVLFRDPAVGKFYSHHSPYTYFTSQELHLGEISLECSRPGAAAVALWATQKLLPLVKGGQFATMLARCRDAALMLHGKLRADDRWLTAFAPELDIVVWMPRAARVSEASELSRRVFTEAARQDLHLALANLPVDFFDLPAAGVERDAESVTCLRSVLMKPEHADWLPQIWEILQRICLLCLLLLSGTLARASDVGKDWGIERQSYVDPVTGVRIQELTRGPSASDNLYFHISNFTADNRFLIFVSNRGGSWQLFRAKVRTGRLVQLTDAPALGAHSACPDHSNARRVYYLRGPEVFSLDILNFKERKIGEIPQPHIGGFGQPTLSKDGKSMALVKKRDQANWEIGLMNTDTGAYRTVISQGFQMAHVQHSPTEPVIFYVWETKGYAPQRSWLVNDDGTANRPFYARTDPKTWFTPLKEWVTHEAWIKNTGEMTMINDKQGVMLVAKDGTTRMISEGDYWHAAARPDGKFLVLDDSRGRIWLMETATGNKRLLATGIRDTVHSVHGHSSFDRLGRYVQFHTGRTHETVALIDLNTLPPVDWTR